MGGLSEIDVVAMKGCGGVGACDIKQPGGGAGCDVGNRGSWANLGRYGWVDGVGKGVAPEIGLEV